MIHLEHLQENGKPVLNIDKTDWLALTSDITDHFVHIIIGDHTTVEAENGDIVYTDQAQEMFNRQLDNVERTLLDWIDVKFNDEESGQ